MIVPLSGGSLTECIRVTAASSAMMDVCRAMVLVGDVVVVGEEALTTAGET
jgi:hypothetical protein